MSDEMGLFRKKGKNFKDVIAEEKNKGRYVKLVMKRLTSLNASLLYSLSFLLLFVIIDVAVYAALEPSVMIWAGVLVASALASSVFASKVTHMLKRQQWKYTSV